MTSSPISDLNPIFIASGCQLELHSRGKSCDGGKKKFYNLELSLVTCFMFWMCLNIFANAVAIFSVNFTRTMALTRN
jgi:hypothetical protein